MTQPCSWLLSSSFLAQLLRWPSGPAPPHFRNQVRLEAEIGPKCSQSNGDHATELIYYFVGPVVITQQLSQLQLDNIEVCEGVWGQGVGEFKSLLFPRSRSVREDTVDIRQMSSWPNHSDIYPTPNPCSWHNGFDSYTIFTVFTLRYTLFNL